jgi:branched-subunit amino acid aminotransferase/4-amino-4-deoxychorismate lyase
MLQLNDLDRRSADPAALRITLTRGAEIGGPPTLCLMARRLSPEHLDKRRHGIALFRLPLHGRGASELAEHKTLSHLPSSLGQVWLARLAGERPAEGLFVNASGEILEGTASNLFVVEGGGLVTPPISAGILRGTSRRKVLDLAASAGIPAAEEPLPIARLAAADEAFLTSSTLRVAPAVSLDGAPLGGGAPGALTRRIQALFEAEVEAEVEAWYADR